MPTMQIFIISWAGQHNNALEIFDKLKIYANYISLVYSDPDPIFQPDLACNMIRRPNDLFWSDKFSACIQSCSSDLMLVIHADTHCDDWLGLAEKCYQAMHGIPAIGVWTPLIDNTPYHVSKTNIAPINGTPLRVVAQTDGIVFCLAKSVIERMRLASYVETLHGWGIDQLFVASAFSTGKLAVVDTSILVRHAEGRGYQTKSAEDEWLPFINKNFTMSEASLHMLLQSFVRNN